MLGRKGGYRFLSATIADIEMLGGVTASVRPYNRGLRDDFSVKFGVYVTILLV